MSENKKKDRGKKRGEKRGRRKGRKLKDGPPKLKKLKNQTLLEGQKLSLKCEAVGNSKPTYKWFKDGTEIKKSKAIRIKTGKKNSRLQISKLKMEDAGEYACEAENPLGKDISKTTVSVQTGEDEENQSQLGGNDPNPSEPAVNYFCCGCTDRSQKYPSSEKICSILVLACLIFLMAFIAGTKWYSVNRKYENELPSLFDLKRVEQSPTENHLTNSLPALLNNMASKRPTLETEEEAATFFDAQTTLPSNSFKSSSSFRLPSFSISSTAFSSTVNSQLQLSPVTENSTQSFSSAELKFISMRELSAATTTTLSPESGHARRCNESEKSYCVNGGVCYYIDGINKLSCKCPNEFTGDRCQHYVMASFYKAEELYQKRVLTITGICVALLVVGIVCVVAYCKTKKQRKKMHSHLRQNLCVDHQNRNLANGPNHPGPLPEDIQMVDYISKNVPVSDNARRHETETSFSASQRSSTSHHSSTATHTSSQRNVNNTWSIEQSDSVTSEMHSGMMNLSLETSKCNSPMEPRGRLSAVCGYQDTRHPIFHCRDSVDSLRDSPHSDRYVSALTTPARLSPVDLHYSLPSYAPVFEVSPHGSAHATLPPAVMGYLVEDEQPLLRRYHKHHQDNVKHDLYKQRRSHLHDSFGSLPPSPARMVEDDEYETTQEYIPALDQPKKMANSNRRWRKTKPNGHISHRAECDCDSNSESCCSDTDSDGEKIGECTPFLSTQNPPAANTETASVFWASESRTYSSNRHNVREDLHTRATRVKSNQDSLPV